MNKLVYIPGYSKSYLHRFIILSWINDLDIVIKNFTPSDDVFATLNALYDSYKIIGGDLYLQKADRVLRDQIYVGESGSTLRFLIPLMLLFQENKEITFITKGRLVDRPLKVFKSLIEDEGGSSDVAGQKIRIKGKLGLKSYSISTEESSQFVSAMLMAGQGKFDVIYQADKSSQYIEITKDAIDIFKTKPAKVYVPVDMSNYSLFYGLYKKNFIEKITPPVARCQKDRVFIDYVNNLQGTYNLKNSIDLAPMLAAYLSTEDGVFTISGLENLKHKESNRLREILRVLKFFNVDCGTNGRDQIYIRGNDEKKNISGSIKVTDHRICHMILFLKIYHNSDLKIKGLESLKKSDYNIYNYFKRYFDVYLR